jgi:hypothetical protein
VAAVGAADAGKALLPVAALQKGLHRAFDDRAPETALGRKPLIIDLLKGLAMLLQQTPQVGEPVPLRKPVQPPIIADKVDRDAKTRSCI